MREGLPFPHKPAWVGIDFSLVVRSYKTIKSTFKGELVYLY